MAFGGLIAPETRYDPEQDPELKKQRTRVRIQQEARAAEQQGQESYARNRELGGYTNMAASRGVDVTRPEFRVNAARAYGVDDRREGEYDVDYKRRMGYREAYGRQVSPGEFDQISAREQLERKKAAATTGVKEISGSNFGPRGEAILKQAGLTGLPGDARYDNPQQRQLRVQAMRALYQDINRDQPAADRFHAQPSAQDQYNGINAQAGVQPIRGPMQTQDFRDRGYLAQPGEPEWSREGRRGGWVDQPFIDQSKVPQQPQAQPPVSGPGNDLTPAADGMNFGQIRDLRNITGREYGLEDVYPEAPATPAPAPVAAPERSMAQRLAPQLNFTLSGQQSPAPPAAPATTGDPARALGLPGPQFAPEQKPTVLPGGFTPQENDIYSADQTLVASAGTATGPIAFEDLDQIAQAKQRIGDYDRRAQGFQQQATAAGGTGMLAAPAAPQRDTGPYRGPLSLTVPGSEEPVVALPAGVNRVQPPAPIDPSLTARALGIQNQGGGLPEDPKLGMARQAQATQARLAEMVAQGRITQEQANAELRKMMAGTQQTAAQTAAAESAFRMDPKNIAAGRAHELEVAKAGRTPIETPLQKAQADLVRQTITQNTQRGGQADAQKQAFITQRYGQIIGNTDYLNAGFTSALTSGDVAPAQATATALEQTLAQDPYASESAVYLMGTDWYNQLQKSLARAKGSWPQMQTDRELAQAYGRMVGLIERLAQQGNQPPQPATNPRALGM